MTDDQLLEGFEACTFPASDFHHPEHVRVAFLYINKYPVLSAIERFSSALKKFAAAAGKPDLYHETITWAFVLLIHERIARAGAGRQQTWAQFADANPDLLDWKNNILKKYYRAATLASPLAKATFLFPDNPGF
jgi:hypothetical protein